MFNRIFGGTEEEQLRFLHIRSIITIVTLGIAIASAFISPTASVGVAVVMIFIWGWNVIKNWFGITTLGALFSGNVVIGVILFVLYILIAYIVGIIFAFIGIGRWLYLIYKMRKRSK